jgi:hypothetical protein
MNDLDRARTVKASKKKITNVKLLVNDLDKNLRSKDDATLKIVIATIEILDNYINKDLPYVLKKALLELPGAVDLEK